MSFHYPIISFIFLHNKFKQIPQLKKKVKDYFKFKFLSYVLSRKFNFFISFIMVGKWIIQNISIKIIPEEWLSCMDVLDPVVVSLQCPYNKNQTFYNITYCTLKNTLKNNVSKF